MNTVHIIVRTSASTVKGATDLKNDLAANVAVEAPASLRPVT
jgi:hypothetical protein